MCHRTFACFASSEPEHPTNSVLLPMPPTQQSKQDVTLPFGMELSQASTSLANEHQDHLYQNHRPRSKLRRKYCPASRESTNRASCPAHNYPEDTLQGCSSGHRKGELCQCRPRKGCTGGVRR